MMTVDEYQKAAARTMNDRVTVKATGATGAIITLPVKSETIERALAGIFRPAGGSYCEQRC